MAVKERTDTLEKAVDVEEMSADDIDGSFIPSIKPEVDGVEIDGEGVIVIEGAWSIHWLNQISTIVFNEFDGVSSIDEIAARLSKAFNADLEVVKTDVLEMARRLGDGGFLEGVAAEQIQSGSSYMEGLPVGTAIPPFELADLRGRTVTAEDLLGQETFLVNWSPRCGFCAQIAPEISKLQPKLRNRGVETVFISIGEPKDIRKQLREFKLDVPVFLQEAHQAEIFYNMGTPAAYLLDAEGKTAAKLAYGSDGVPVLLRKAAGVSAKGNGSRSRKSTRSKASTRSKTRASTRARAAGAKRRTASKR